MRIRPSAGGGLGVRNRWSPVNGTFWPVLAGAIAGWLVSPSGLAQDATQVVAGKAIWVDAGCDGCHGANGQGGTSPDLPHGPSLHSSKLNHDELVQVISCGRPDTQMPAW